MVHRYHCLSPRKLNSFPRVRHVCVCVLLTHRQHGTVLRAQTSISAQYMRRSAPVNLACRHCCTAAPCTPVLPADSLWHAGCTWGMLALPRSTPLSTAANWWVSCTLHAMIMSLSCMGVLTSPLCLISCCPCMLAPAARPSLPACCPLSCSSQGKEKGSHIPGLVRVHSV
jgi:hypothetical protein